jgi:malate synthase
MKVHTPEPSIRIQATDFPASESILTAEALAFLAELHRQFEERRRELLQKRVVRQERIDAGQLPGFLSETESIRRADWKAAPIPADLMDRRVEITGPVDRKMVINALNSGANVFMADLEDSNSPTWENVVSGQANLRAAVCGDIRFTSPEGREYALGPNPAVLFVRPRGWHMVERHLLMDGAPVSASLMDFGLFFFHNALTLHEKGKRPYFYLPKMQSYLEARLWNDVFLFAQEYLGIPRGTIRATVLIETLMAAFEMDEILYELQEHSAGLNCGRWDYIFSFIKVLRNHRSFLLPDRSQLTMDRAFLRTYVELLIQTCHRREIHAMGGMAAQIPIKNDPAANEIALEKVRQDKLREVKAGHDGTWVAHPALVPVARQVFDQHMRTPHQIHAKRQNVPITSSDLMKVPPRDITDAGLRLNIDVGIQYLESWLRGNGCVPIYNLMEDAATAEISRAQVWQWLHHGAKLSDGRTVTRELVRDTAASVLQSLELRLAAAPQSKLRQAAELFDQMMLNQELAEFLTLEAYRFI